MGRAWVAEHTLMVVLASMGVVAAAAAAVAVAVVGWSLMGVELRDGRKGT